ncbi:M15 family metallopeptidase [Pisciglobus halotolerans]|uniref:D-alanyl-D-alanine carboxypeptidase n=1 Tax=Pisciglobus halotolerans TaxID=745365 RepID=A0A1I3C4E9_9LACT|nr:M15 family metallopeptidase [Pisciglobus halotolerans]SFH69424.1 D-alanyl-D-alanine carboxypeptidase [Pisciglobus halotolerans]
MKLKWMIPLIATSVLAGCSQLEGTQQISDSSTKESVQSEAASSSSEMTKEEKEHQEMLAELPDVSTSDWNLILVNNWTPIDKDTEKGIPLKEVEEGKQMDERIVDAYQTWMKDAAKAGYSVYLASAYRSISHQETNYNNKIKHYMNEGYSKEEAVQRTEDYIAIPGGSEHHTGLALDMVDIDWINAGHGLDPEYDTQESQQWLVSTMADHGFILRFPKDKEKETGIKYESWHFRYVGKENAKYIEKHQLSLEEYIDLLKEAGK